ncbi:amidohydrolase family protein [Pontibacter actiniarum]|uniref:Amidohydrolase-related domain-containing protein n=1 Tax=Pontibacter actiniarum TaxID=323450 RepID=A0A1X9YQK4_9BACT|nr:amidohydrolase family protein [Pontibacter actiniarum]ARS35166.1 hypothetical protein CA264_06760 [Pontibacter actiniarum]
MKITLDSFLLLTFLWLTAACQPKQKVDYIIHNVRLFDGVEVREEVSVVVDDGKIVDITSEIGRYIAEEVIEAGGYTIIPPLIDAHVHISSLAQLHASLREGVFAVVDLHSPPGVANKLKASRDSFLHASLLSSGPALTVAGGHGTQFGAPIPTVTKEREPRTFVADRVKEGADLLKIIREPMLPTLDYETIGALIKASHQFDKLAVGHISTAGDATKISELGIDVVSHIWLDRKMTDEELSLLQEKKPFVIPTLLVTRELLQFREKQGGANHYLPFQDIRQEVNRLHKAGITLLAGTDAPNLGLKFGESLITEMKLLVSVGLSETEALKTATVKPIQAFGLDQNLLPRRGHSANFILVEGNPTVDITSLQKIKEVWVMGKRTKK